MPKKYAMSGSPMQRQFHRPSPMRTLATNQTKEHAHNQNGDGAATQNASASGGRRKRVHRRARSTRGRAAPTRVGSPAASATGYTAGVKTNIDVSAAIQPSSSGVRAP